MDVKVPHLKDEQKLPLLHNMDIVEPQKTLFHRAINQTCKSTAHLSNLLPTGTVLSYQILSPIFTNHGKCNDDPVTKLITLSLLSLCAASCFLLCFTDSFRDNKGNICYGFATCKGLWIIDGSATLPRELDAKYRLRFIDFMHAVMSILVFSAIALFDHNVVKCFFPSPSDEMRQILTALPVGIGVFCSMMFVVFPTRRHGIGFPVSTN